MNKKAVIFGAVACSFLLAGCNSSSIRSATGAFNQAMNPTSTATEAVSGGSATSSGSDIAASTAPVAYKNNDHRFSFIIPAGWSKQSGDANSDNVLFMRVPISDSCSFQFHITRMRPSFPAESSVKASLKAAKEDITIGKLLSAKRRDEKGKENGKTVRFTRGWEVVEKGSPGGHQRIIYQAYDRDNYYFNFMGAANTENFEKCRPQLREIIDSISFGD
jgi:hypothetical protein